MQIYDHDSPEAITYKNNSIELENWLEHLAYIDKEITSLLNIGKTDRANSDDFEPILSDLESKKKENSIAIDKFNEYRNNLPKAAECEDVSCDMFYVNEHDKYRKSYRAHLESYRKTKEEYFDILSK